ncbi:hypothetical protein AB0D57_47305 [Streptomyces sp. NPDC048275]|uniref:hypothetical protein n=1 Tax=Streptomyces sp. NPDC048275 TaxID=3155629 RepID=UPI0033EFDDE9
MNIFVVGKGDIPSGHCGGSPRPRNPLRSRPGQRGVQRGALLPRDKIEAAALWAVQNRHGRLRNASPQFRVHPHTSRVGKGDFSPEDCDDYLARRLTRDGQPLIGENIRQVITARSHGLPLYLDLSVARFLELRRSGHTLQPGDFDHDFPALVSRTLSDLTPTNATSCAR